MKRRNFCELGPWAYAISLRKQIVMRHIRNRVGPELFSSLRQEELLPVVVASQRIPMLKHGNGIDPVLQQNKVHNIQLACTRINGILVKPGETFSFWQCVGKTSRKNGFKEGRVLINGKLVAGTGGGLCNLANTINRVILHSPLTITELHHHSDALAPDPNGMRIPYSAGTSVSYNYIDYRFRNDTTQPVQLCTWCEGVTLHAELRTTHPFPYTYRLTEEDHHFCQENDGHYYRNSRIFRETLDRATGQLLHRELHWKNHSKVMFDSALIPTSQLRTDKEKTINQTKQ